jgi:hypothetical protein
MKRVSISSRNLQIALFFLAVLLLMVPHVMADCPTGCTCLTPDDAKKLGYTDCSEKPVLCSPANANALMYCYRAPVTLVAVTRTLVPVTATTTAAPACPTGCDCLTDDQARANYGTFEHCSETPCAKAVTGSATLIAYCSKPAYPACPSGCECMNELQARERFGTYERCSNTQCAATTAATSNFPPYCFRAIQPVCTAPCECMTDAQARTKFGEGGYTRCSATPCGSESMTAAPIVTDKFCFQQAAAVLPAGQCPAGCSCMSEAAAKEKGYPACRGQRTSCGYDANQVQLFCFEVVPSTTCTYDYQRNACTGTCQQGYSCSIIAQEKDATGVVKYGVCGCQPPATECTYNANLNACTGTCKEGSCVITGKKTDASGAVSIVCGCESPACLFDYAKDACTGSCPAGSGTCQLNTIYRDAAGKTIYGECHCKGIPEQTPVTVTVTKTPQPVTPCTCSAAGYCTGNCPEGQTCQMTATTTDNLGKISCTECSCKEICTLTATNECVGPCPNGMPCERLVSRDATGAEKVSCVCREGAATCTCTGGICTGDCPGDQTCFPIAIETDALGRKLGCSECSCTDTCTLTATNECAGPCPTGGNCVRSVKRNAATGAEEVGCLCESNSCSLTLSNECTGSCPTGGACEKKVRDAGAGWEYTSCECPGAPGTAATPTATPGAPAGDILSAIASFFKSLFGMK